MPSEEKLNLDGISITLYRSKKAKNINIRIRPFKGVRVAVPRLASFRQAKQFVLLRKHWIEKHASKMKQFEDRQTIFNWDTQFKTKYRTVKFTKHKIIRYSGRNNYYLYNYNKRDTLPVEQSILPAIY